MKGVDIFLENKEKRQRKEINDFKWRKGDILKLAECYITLQLHFPKSLLAIKFSAWNQLKPSIPQWSFKDFFYGKTKPL